MILSSDLFLATTTFTTTDTMWVNIILNTTDVNHTSHVLSMCIYESLVVNTKGQSI